MASITATSSRTLRVLILGASTFALSAPALANQVIFPTSGTEVLTDQRTTQRSGITQIKLKSGAIVSISEGAEYTLNADGSINLHNGSITVAGPPRARLDVRMPGGVVGQIVGTSSSGSFSVTEDGISSGHTLTGVVRVSTDGKRRMPYRDGQMWSAKPGENPERTFANAAIEQPSATAAPIPAPDENVAIGGDAGPVNAALYGIPVTLGDGLAAVGASSDIIEAGRRVEAAVANPSIERFPSGDLALLVVLSADLEGLYGGTPFNAAQANVIRTYLAFLASGASGADFLTAYSDFTLGYLELIRAGGVPSAFASGIAQAADIDAYLAFITRNGAISALSAQDRLLADAYLTFLSSGQDRDAFASSFTDLTAAYFAFLRSGGVPADFTGASQAALADTIAFLQQSGLLVQLSASDQALIAAFLKNGGLGFAGEFQAALQQYFTFLESGRRPSEYTELDQATLRAYLETLSNTGLLTTLLGERAQFYSDYLAFLRAGGDVDGFAGLPANIFAGYQTALAAYFEFLENGGIPSAYTPLSQEVIAQYLAVLEKAGATQVFLGDLTQFYQAYFAFLSGGGNPDNFAGLPVPPDFPAFASALNAYATFLAANGLPSDFTGNDLAQLQELFAALQQAGRVEELLSDNAELLSAYFAFIEAGGGVDAFAGLPIYLDYIAALNAYFEFLAAGNLPSAYTVLDQATIEAYLAALAALQDGLAGFSDLNQFFVSYYNFLLAGNDPDLFDGLPGQTGGGNGNGNSGTFADFLPGETVTAFSVGAQRSGRIRINNPAVAQDGALTGDFFAPGTARITDVGGDERGIVGAYRDGTFSFDNGETFRDLGPNQALHYVGLQPIIGELPTTGKIDYDVIAATAPTYSDGSTGSGVFDANLTVGFGSSITYGIDGTITMPDATYTFASPGRDSGDLVAPQVASADFFVIRPDLTGPGSACTAGQRCQLNMFGKFGGTDPEERVGFAYESINFDIFDATAVTGAVLFGPVGTFDPGDTGDGSTGSGVIHPANFAYNGGFDDSGDVLSLVRVGGFEAFGLHTPELTAAGELERTTNGWFDTPSNGAFFDIQGDEKGLIGRYGGGRVNLDGRFFFGVPLDAGAHYSVLAPFTGTLPTGLQIEYDLLGATRPTFSDGAFGPGSFSGTLSVDYQSSFINSLFAGSVEMTEETGSVRYDFSAQIVERNLLDWVQEGTQGFSSDVTGTGRVCPSGSDCQIKVILGGGGENGVERVGVAYELVDVNVGISIEGAALFGRPGTSMATARGVASIDWSRWTAPVAETSASIDPPNLMNSTSAKRTAATTDPTPHSEAIRRAQAMMGGMISWSDTARR